MRLSLWQATATLLLIITPPSGASPFDEAMKKGEHQAAYLIAWRHARKGHAQAQYDLGTLYERGQGVGRSSEKALLWYGRSAVQGHSKARREFFGLAGSGTPLPQEPEVLAWLQAWARKGDPAAKQLVAEAGRTPVPASTETTVTSATPSPATGVSRTAAAATPTGSAKPSFRRGPSSDESVMDRFHELRQAKKYAEAMVALEPLAAREDPEALYWQGYMHSMANSWKPERDYTRAEACYRRAAELGHGVAQAAMGDIYEQARGPFERDYPQALMWYEKGVASNEPGAMVGMCRMYLNGLGVPEDLEKAYEYARQARDLGFGGGFVHIKIKMDQEEYEANLTRQTARFVEELRQLSSAELDRELAKVQGNSYYRTLAYRDAVKEAHRLKANDRQRELRERQRAQEAVDARRNAEWSANFEARRQATFEAGRRKIESDTARRNAAFEQRQKDIAHQRKMDYIQGRTSVKPRDMY